MITHVRGPVVVGVDGSAEARRAIMFGAEEARRRRVPLRLVCAQPALAMGRSSGMVVSSAAARELLAAAEKEIAVAWPDVSVESDVMVGSAAGVLVAESELAALVVIGTRATGGLLGHLAGSVAAQVATHASAPVVVLRPAAGPDDEWAGVVGRPVVVGIDGSAESERAMAFAVDEAVARNSDIHAVYVWSVLGVHHIGPIVAEQFVNSEAASKADRLLTEATSGWSDRYPDLTITRHPVHDLDVIGGLVRAGDGAGLIVVGSRGHGGFLGLRLGSTVDGLIRYASTSVAVVRGFYTERR